MRNILKLALGVSLLAVSLQGSTIHLAPPNQSGGSDLNYYVETDNFTVTDAFLNITSVKFWALANGAGDYTGSIRWSLYPDTAGLPGSPLISALATVSMAATGTMVGNYTEYALTLPINYVVSAGMYWIGLHNGPTSSQPGGEFYWEWSDGSAGNSQQYDLIANTGWVSNFSELAFQVDGTAVTPQVPEPATMGLMSVALGALAVLGRRRK